MQLPGNRKGETMFSCCIRSTALASKNAGYPQFSILAHVNNEPPSLAINSAPLLRNQTETVRLRQHLANEGSSLIHSAAPSSSALFAAVPNQSVHNNFYIAIHVSSAASSAKIDE
eukprot:3417681-Amphidinium_carterae.1